MSESTSGSGAKMVRHIADTISEVTETAGDVGRHASDKIEAIRDTVAGTLNETSAAIQDSGKQISQIADAAAQKIQDGADYVRETDLRVIATDVKGFVKRYPVASVAVGLGVGFLLAWGLRNRD